MKIFLALLISKATATDSRRSETNVTNLVSSHDSTVQSGSEKFKDEEGTMLNRKIASKQTNKLLILICFTDTFLHTNNIRKRRGVCWTWCDIDPEEVDEIVNKNKGDREEKEEYREDHPRKILFAIEILLLVYIKIEFQQTGMHGVIGELVISIVEQANRLDHEHVTIF